MNRDRSKLFSQVTNAVLCTCAVLLTAVILKRELFPPVSVNGQNRDVRIPNSRWLPMLHGGAVLGKSAAPIRIVVFSDFECPFCKGFATGAMRGILHHFPNEVAVVFRHFPLEYHKFARPAAIAAACAERQGDFHGFHDLLFETQDSLGLIPFQQLAQRRPSIDELEFASCIESGATLSTILADRALGDSLGVSGTPGVIVNGILLGDPPDSIGLHNMIDSLTSLRAAPSR